jgi:hypothetical protein
MVTSVLAQDAFGNAVANPHYLVLFLTLKVVVPSVMASPAPVTAGSGPPTFG